MRKFSLHSNIFTLHFNIRQLLPQKRKNAEIVYAYQCYRGEGGAIPILGDFKLSLGMRTFPFKNPKDMEHNTIDKLCQFHDSQGISENQDLVTG